MDTAERTAVGEATTYDGFISYSHAADDLLAPRLQSALQRFAKPWWKRRAVRIFRDESSLSANPHLWSSITKALDESAWFVLLLSPDAAQSPWVNQEIEYWKDHRDPTRILPVLTDGIFVWSNGDITGDAVPYALQGVFAEEPRWVDLRFARGEDQLDLKNPRFSAAVADIASALRGVPKDELESEEVKQHRRTIRTAWAGVAAIGVLAVAAGVFALQSAANAREAETQRIAAETEADRADANAEAEAEARQRAESAAAAEAEARQDAETAAQLAEARELAGSSIAVLDRDPELSTLLAIAAISATPDGFEKPLEVINSLWRAGSSNRLVDVLETGHPGYLDLSESGERLAVTTASNELQLIDLTSKAAVWTYSEETADYFSIPALSGDGRLALSVIDSTAEAVPKLIEESDELANRLLILDVADGSLLHVIEFPDCVGVEVPSWSPDATYLGIASGAEGCGRNGVRNWIEIYDTATWEAVAFLPFEGDRLGPIARWDDSGRLYGLRPYGQPGIFEPPTFEPVHLPWLSDEIEESEDSASGIGDVTPNGTRLLLAVGDGSEFNAYLFDVDTGTLRDTFPGTAHPAIPLGLSVTPDGRYAIVGSSGATTSIFDLTDGTRLFKLPTGEIFGSAYDPGARLLYTTGAEPGVKVWDLGNSSVGIDPTGDLGSYTFVNGNSFEFGSGVAALTAIDRGVGSWSIRFFDPATGDLQPDPIVDAAPGTFLTNGKMLGFDFTSARQILIDPDTRESIELDPCQRSQEDENGELVCVGEGEPAWYNVEAVSDGTELLAIGYNGPDDPSGHLAILDPDTGDVVERIADGPRLPVAEITEEWSVGPLSGAGTVAVNRQTGEILYSGPGTQHNVLSPSSSLLAMNPGQTNLVIVDTENWEVVVRVDGTARIRGLAFNDDETRIAVGDTDSLYVVDIETGLIVQQMRIPGVSDIHWLSADTVLVGTSDGQFGTISLATDSFLDTVRQHLRRSFSNQECATYRIDPCPTLEELRDG